MNLIYLYAVLLTCACLASFSLAVQLDSNSQRSFTIDYDNDTFLKDGQPFQYISGSIHYFRLLPADWDDRLAKMRAAGLNAVQIYVPWNFHVPRPGQHRFTGSADLDLFLALAQKHDLLVIVRAGPYICAEWDFGGLPAWLLQRNASMVMRSSDPQFLAAVDEWMAVLLPIIARRLYSSGGNVIMVQLENEYGSTGQCDLAYIRHLYQLGRRYLGNQTVLFSTDGQSAGFLKCVAKERLFYATVDFGPEGTKSLNDTFAPLRAVQPKGPLVNSEYYAGWLDNWSGQHAQVDAKAVSDGLARMLAYGVSVNIYMFFGGTNFGYWNGANSPPLAPQPTSYDYDAPLAENGDTRYKYQLIRQVIINATGRQPPPVPPNSTVSSLGTVKLRRLASLLGNLDSLIVNRVDSKLPVAMETLGQYQGFALYGAQIPKGYDATEYSLRLAKARDFVYAFASSESQPSLGQFLGSISYSDSEAVLNFTASNSSGVRNLWLLVENCGHVNYGGDLQGNVKGILGSVTLNGAPLYGWRSYALDFDRLAARPLRSRRLAASAEAHKGQDAAQAAQASLYMGEFTLDKNNLTDTYANLSTFCKGQLWINGFNLGRYWPCAGPQVTLYVPGAVLREGSNSIAVLELLQAPCLNDSSCRVDFLAMPDIGLSRPAGESVGRLEYDRESLQVLATAEELPQLDDGRM
ncbi:hypothetical protein BOX15_Mlig017556g2 [Macrostomum lignano]|uniref:Beta-galactosidase n=2 Tax=Macrostomum lignano TaxID=282301 RepID=A0A1I8HPV3_9PLAT|nr:hypothetical protein BOX15_Mlig017556g2 [Macrostomum lignano]